jgi:flagellar basal-body rod protein FlgB
LVSRIDNVGTHRFHDIYKGVGSLLIGDSVTQTLGRALDVNWFRQQLISNNIANVDTPNYKRQDIDFQQTLKRAMDGSGEISMTRTNEQDLGKTRDGEVQPVMINSAPDTLRNDGNNVDIDNEMAQQAMNSLQYNALARLESDQLGMLKTAITEGRS